MSAHNCGAGRAATEDELRAALARLDHVPCEYVEFDVQITRDGEFVVLHDTDVAFDGRRRPVSDLTSEQLRKLRPGLPRYEDVLHLLAGRKKAHIDLKFVSDRGQWRPEIEAARRAVAVLGADNVVLTTGRDDMVAALVGWSSVEQPGLRVGLTVGGHRRGLGLLAQLRWQWGQVFPAARAARCGAHVVAAHRLLARLTVARWAARVDMPLLVWTVDRPRPLARWLSDPRVWMVTTNVPERAVQIRRRLAA